MVKKTYKDYKEYLLEKLKDPKKAFAYLNEALLDEDQRVFLLALKDVIEAQGIDMATLAIESDLNRQNLHRILSKSGNPKLSSIRSILHTAGFELALQPHKRN